MIIVFWWFGASRESAHHAHRHGSAGTVPERGANLMERPITSAFCGAGLAPYFRAKCAVHKKKKHSDCFVLD